MTVARRPSTRCPRPRHRAAPGSRVHRRRVISDARGDDDVGGCSADVHELREPGRLVPVHRVGRDGQPGVGAHPRGGRRKRGVVARRRLPLRPIRSARAGSSMGLRPALTASTASGRRSMPVTSCSRSASTAASGAPSLPSPTTETRTFVRNCTTAGSCESLRPAVAYGLFRADAIPRPGRSSSSPRAAARPGHPGRARAQREPEGRGRLARPQRVRPQVSGLAGAIRL